MAWLLLEATTVLTSSWPTSSPPGSGGYITRWPHLRTSRRDQRTISSPKPGGTGSFITLRKTSPATYPGDTPSQFRLPWRIIWPPSETPVRPAAHLTREISLSVKLKTRRPPGGMSSRGQGHCLPLMERINYCKAACWEINNVWGPISVWNLILKCNQSQ